MDNIVRTKTSFERLIEIVTTNLSGDTATYFVCSQNLIDSGKCNCATMKGKLFSISIIVQRDWCIVSCIYYIYM